MGGGCCTTDPGMTVLVVGVIVLTVVGVISVAREAGDLGYGEDPAVVRLVAWYTIVVVDV